MRRRAALVASIGSFAAAAAGSACAPGAAKAPRAAGKLATIELEKGGTFTIQLFADVAPGHVKNFEEKANKGFYNGLVFHRVEDWVVQGGDPQGSGVGGGNMPSELNDKPFIAGAVGVPRVQGGDPRIDNDSQFFICLQAAHHLDKLFTNFGQVVDGIDVVKAIKIGDKLKRVTVTG